MLRMCSLYHLSTKRNLTLEMMNSCAGCHTLKNGILKMMTFYLGQIKDVVVSKILKQLNDLNKLSNQIILILYFQLPISDPYVFKLIRQAIIKAMSRQPFIIKTKLIQPTVPVDSQVYDDAQQTRIQILIAISGYLTINMLVQSFKIFWSFWHFRTQCPAFSYLSLGFMAINIIWAICSFYGFRSIRSKNSRNIRIYGYTVFGNLLLRIAMYIVCGVVMTGYVPTYANITQDELNNLICTALYPKGLYIIMGIIEALISVLVLFLLSSVVLYVQKWEESQTIKHIPKTKFKSQNQY